MSSHPTWKKAVFLLLLAGNTANSPWEQVLQGYYRDFIRWHLAPELRRFQPWGTPVRHLRMRSARNSYSKAMLIRSTTTSTLIMFVSETHFPYGTIIHQHDLSPKEIHPMEWMKLSRDLRRPVDVLIRANDDTFMIYDDGLVLYGNLYCGLWNHFNYGPGRVVGNAFHMRWIFNRRPYCPTRVMAMPRNRRTDGGFLLFFAYLMEFGTVHVRMIDSTALAVSNEFATHAILHEFDVHSSTAVWFTAPEMAISDDGSLFYLVPIEIQGIIVTDVETGTPLCNIRTSDFVFSMAAAPGGTGCVCLMRNGYIIVYDNDGTERHKWDARQPGHLEEPRRLSVAPDTGEVVVCTPDMEHISWFS